MEGHTSTEMRSRAFRGCGESRCVGERGQRKKAIKEKEERTAGQNFPKCWRMWPVFWSRMSGYAEKLINWKLNKKSIWGPSGWLKQTRPELVVCYTKDMGFLLSTAAWTSDIIFRWSSAIYPNQDSNQILKNFICYFNFSFIKAQEQTRRRCKT